MPEEIYTVVHLTETDGDGTLHTGTTIQLAGYINDMGLCRCDCTFIKGAVVDNPILSTVFAEDSE